LVYFLYTHPSPTQLYPLSLHDALPISAAARKFVPQRLPWGDPDISGNYTTKDEANTPFERPQEFAGKRLEDVTPAELAAANEVRSEEHTSELQSLAYLVCRLLLEKKKK